VQDSVDPSAQWVSLTGTALAPWLLATPSNVSFPATIVGQSSTLAVTVSNSGTSALTISVITIAASPPATPSIAPVSPALDIAKLRDTIKTADIKAIEVKSFEKGVDKTLEKVTASRRRAARCSREPPVPST
jgi:hypothetical protein